MEAEIVNISRFSWLRHKRSNPENVHTVTNMQDWLSTHPVHQYQKMIDHIFSLPQKNIELTQKNLEISREIGIAQLEIWLKFFSIMMWQWSSIQQKKEKNHISL